MAQRTHDLIPGQVTSSPHSDGGPGVGTVPAWKSGADSMRTVAGRCLRLEGVSRRPTRRSMRGRRVSVGLSGAQPEQCAAEVGDVSPTSDPDVPKDERFRRVGWSGEASDTEGRSQALRCRECGESREEGWVKVVLDTNVFVSGVFFSGSPFEILSAWRD